MRRRSVVTEAPAEIRRRILAALDGEDAGTGEREGPGRVARRRISIGVWAPLGLAATRDETHNLMVEALRKVGLRPEDTLGRYRPKRSQD